nr:hypothetical protein [uncultured Blautia sp.]
MTEAFLKQKVLEIYRQLCYGAEENIHGETQAYLYLPNGRYIEVTYKEKEIPYFVWQVRCVQSIQEHGLYELKLESLHQRTNFSLCTQDLESCIRAAVPIQPVSEEVAACLNEMQRKGLPVFSGNVRDMEKYIANFLHHCRNRMDAYLNSVETLQALLRSFQGGADMERITKLLNYI